MPTARPLPALPTGTTRRAALVAGGAALGLVATGCGQASSSSDASVPDAVLDAVRSELAGAVALVAATRRRHRSLRGRLAGLEVAHATQLAALDPDAETDEAPEPAVPGDAGDALARLRLAEERLQRRLLTWAVAVDSGPLARVLASAAAGTAQQLAVLGRPLGPGATA